jgi:hypothetical protein
LAARRKALNGATEDWAVEGGTPNTLLRRALRATRFRWNRDRRGWLTRRGDHSLLRGNGRNITFTDGRKLFMGSSGTGAPKERR